MTSLAAGPITTTDYHTAGEPFRIVTGGLPALEGRTRIEPAALGGDVSLIGSLPIVNERMGDPAYAGSRASHAATTVQGATRP